GSRGALRFPASSFSLFAPCLPARQSTPPMWGPPGSRAIGYHPSPMANGLPEGPLLGVWAHPDDETYLSAGLMAASVAGGSRVVCVPATRGEGGSLGHRRWPPSGVGRGREAGRLAWLGVPGRAGRLRPDA